MTQLSQKGNQNNNLIIYGFGSTGKFIVDSLIAEGIDVDQIVDKNKSGTLYKDIPIINLEELKKINTKNSNCLITLHNHYVNINELYIQLSKFEFKNIYSLINLPKIFKNIRLNTGYWLDYSFSYPEHKNSIAAFQNLLSDTKSIELTNQILKYREFGNIEDCPYPSLFDEYTPNDLPRYKSPLRLIDCGAFTGVAIEKFISSGYEIDSFVAFEPDLINFEKLAGKTFNVNQSICLPLGVWSSHTQLRFNSNSSMGSGIDINGDTIIQCVRIDDIIKDFKPNLIKFDVEGAEIESIKGLEKTIKNHKPNLCISLYHSPSHLFEIPLLINSWKLGYKFYLRVHEFNTFGVVLYCFQDNLILN